MVIIMSLLLCFAMVMSLYSDSSGGNHIYVNLFFLIFVCLIFFYRFLFCLAKIYQSSMIIMIIVTFQYLLLSWPFYLNED